MLKGRDILIALHAKHNGDWFGIYQDINDKVHIEEEETIKTARNFEKKHRKVITILDDEYPDDLKFKKMPPFVLVED